MAIARGLAGHGAEVILNGRDPDKLAAAAATIATLGHKVSTSRFDVTAADGVAEGVAAIEETGAIDILVNNAGMQFRSRLQDFPVEKWGRCSPRTFPASST